MTNLTKVYLKSGEVYVNSASVIVWTVLGSCVAVALHSPRKGLTAISHAQLPSPSHKKDACSHSCPKPCFQQHEDIVSEMRFLSCSTKYMLDELHKMGIENSELKAYIFGGSSMFQVEKDYFSVGKRNVDMALTMLKNFGIPVVEKDVLGNQSRTINFNTYSAEFTIELGD
jgi:chemotaxis receptor (MCP) glutamine deamidase CheD